MRVVGYTYAEFDHRGRLLKARFDPTKFCLLSTRAPCRKCYAQPGSPCVTPRGCGTRTHQIRVGDSMRLREPALA